jgi:DNA-binding transcriptional LysR family regulator
MEGRVLDQLSDVTAFVRVADARSFTLAAERMGVSRSAVGKCIARLEGRLATRLIHRTTRSVALTEEGRLFYDHAVRILCEVDDAEAALAQRRQAPKGRLRIDMPIALGRIHILPSLQGFLARWPDLEADVTFSDDYRDLAADGVDVAIRVGGPADSGLIRRVLSRHHFVTCAAPAYLEARGEPAAIDELQRHDKIVFTVCGSATPWRFTANGEDREVSVGGALRLNNTEAVRDAALAGKGLVQLGAFLVGEDLRQGRLTPVLADYWREEAPICAVYPTRRHLSPKVRLFIDHIQAEWAAGPPWK